VGQIPLQILVGVCDFLTLYAVELYMGICESLFTVISYNSINHGQISVQSHLVFEQLINMFVVMNFVFYNGVLMNSTNYRETF
jgi:hypothetical protein